MIYAPWSGGLQTVLHFSSIMTDVGSIYENFRFPEIFEFLIKMKCYSCGCDTNLKQSFDYRLKNKTWMKMLKMRPFKASAKKCSFFNGAHMRTEQWIYSVSSSIWKLPFQYEIIRYEQGSAWTTFHEFGDPGVVAEIDKFFRSKFIRGRAISGCFVQLSVVRYMIINTHWKTPCRYFVGMGNRFFRE